MESRDFVFFSPPARRRGGGSLPVSLNGPAANTCALRCAEQGKVNVAWRGSEEGKEEKCGKGKGEGRGKGEGGKR